MRTEPLGKAEVDSSILSGGTIFPLCHKGFPLAIIPLPTSKWGNGTRKLYLEVGESWGPVREVFW